MNENYLKNLLKKYNLKPNFTYGQNFLIDDGVLDEIVDAAQINSSNSILEIGPGIGNLTRRLCDKAGFVLSIEKDPKFQPVLHAIKKDYPKNFRFEIVDALGFNFKDFFKEQGVSSYKVVANIPYYITGKILDMLMTAKFKPSSVTVLAQKEVAERVCAAPGDLSVLAISVQIYGRPKFIRAVSKNSFYPAPKVDSAILHIDLSQPTKYQITDEKKFFKIVKACFAGKRKQIHNTLVNNLKLEKNQAISILNSIGISPKARPQELTIGEWVQLSGMIDHD